MRRTAVVVAVLAALVGCDHDEDRAARDQGPSTGSGVPGREPNLSFAQDPEADPGATSESVVVRFVVRYDTSVELPADEAVPATDIRWTVTREDGAQASANTIPSIAPGSAGQVPVETTISPVRAGERLTIRLDTTDRVSESSEIDNVRTVIVELGPVVAAG